MWQKILKQPCMILILCAIRVGVVAQELPEVPVISREVINGGPGRLTSDLMVGPKIEPYRMSADGRIGVADNQVVLLTPEAIQVPFMNSAPGRRLEGKKFYLDYSKLLADTDPKAVAPNTLLCDPAPQFRAPSSRANPYACGANQQDDCYDLKLVGLPAGKIWAADLKIRVTNPKTSNAAIASVEYGRSVMKNWGSPFTDGSVVEPMMPRDGRLLIGRSHGAMLTWQDSTGKNRRDFHDIFYAVLPETAQACDITQFDKIYPLTHAPYDPEMVRRYPFAKYPFRDPKGNVIPDGAHMLWSYPWVDSHARMIGATFDAREFVKTYLPVPSSLIESELDKLEKSDVKGLRILPAILKPILALATHQQMQGECKDVHNGDSSKPISDCKNSHLVNQSGRQMRFGVMGLWTKGKLYPIDGMLNQLDFQMGTAKTYVTQVFKPKSGPQGNESGQMELGSSRNLTTSRNYSWLDTNGNKITESGLTSTLFESIENRFNYHRHMHPVTPRDVVWLGSKHFSDEFNFDDVLSPDALIVSDMTASLDIKRNGLLSDFVGATINELISTDGWDYRTSKFSGSVEVQNAATTAASFLKVPASGLVKNGRMEYASVGGVYGKGLWLNGQASIDYVIEAQPINVQNYPWSLNIFFDPRFVSDNIERTLLSFPDKSEISLLGHRMLMFRDKNSGLLRSVQLPSGLVGSQQWTHLGLVIDNLQHLIRVSINGFPLDKWDVKLDNSTFQMTPGLFRVGYSQNYRNHGFKGWIDQLTVFAHRPSTYEVGCNYAMGTLVGLPDGYQGSLLSMAQKYPPSMHALVSAQLAINGKQTYPKYACYHDYTGDYKAHLGNIPSDVVSVREALNFPEGPKYHDAPRPASNFNQFCLSCHREQEKTDSLKIKALMKNDRLPTYLDSRRQPLQPDARVMGNIPANWLTASTGIANPPIQAPDEGYPVDVLMMPSRVGQLPEALALVAVDSRDGTDLFSVTEGSLLNLYDFSSSEPLALRISANGLTDRVDVKLVQADGTVVLQETIGYPYSLFGVNGQRYIGSNLEPGRYQLVAKAIGGQTELRRSFEVIVGSGSASNRPRLSGLTGLREEDNLEQPAPLPLASMETLQRPADPPKTWWENLVIFYKDVVDGAVALGEGLGGVFNALINRLTLGLVNIKDFLF